MFPTMIGTVVIAGIIGYLAERSNFTHNGILQSIIICVGGAFFFYFQTPSLADALQYKDFQFIANLAARKIGNGDVGVTFFAQNIPLVNRQFGAIGQL